MKRFKEKDGFKKHILIVDDEFANREILGNIFNGVYEVTYAEDGEQAMEILGERPYDFSLILLDLLMPKMDGFTVIKLCKENELLKRIPIIVMTSEKDAEIESIKLGAIDFITKPYDMPEVILARTERIIEFAEDKNIIQATEKDSLTGLYTKEYFLRYISQIEHYAPETKMDAVVLNIDHFHLINEIYGRDFGDEVLVLVANELLDMIEQKKGGLASRINADIFYVYLEHKGIYGYNVLERINKQIYERTSTHNIRVRLGVYPDVDKSVQPEMWYDRAVIACNRIREDYTRNVAYYDNSLYERAIYEEKLIRDFYTAVSEKQLMVYFQPKYNITGEKPRLSSAEALIRWKHPELGMISPGDFVPLFEGNGLIQQLDNYVWEEAARQIKEWKDKYGVTIPVSVNVSRIDIYDPKLFDKLTNLIEKYGLTTNEYMLEITESAYSDNVNELIEVVNKLRGRGFKIELDDFGSGYSSLNMLTTLPIDVLKMDMKFIRNMLVDYKNLKLVEIILDIARLLKVPVIAEGVEEEKQYQTLRDRGCDVIQGYYFSKPLPAAEFNLLIEKDLKENQ
ncbi:MAG: EAL domain-containing protein [Lachnospiraceae bacterium]|nr:EAL domain-containing protein [Lachnospiraceae bacterium]